MTKADRSSIVPVLILFLLVSMGTIAYRHIVSGRFETELRHERHLPSSGDSQGNGEPSVAYILGGTQNSLVGKFKTAGALYRGGFVGRVLMLHRPGITEYSPELGRNYTNDEWAAVHLKNEGVGRESLEFVAIPPAILSTFAEARNISAIVRSRGARRLVLVSSQHHTVRVWRSFSHFNPDKKLDLYVYGSDEKAGILELLREWAVLTAYRFFVFPFDRSGSDP